MANDRFLVYKERSGRGITRDQRMSFRFSPGEKRILEVLALLGGNDVTMSGIVVSGILMILEASGVPAVKRCRECGGVSIFEVRGDFPLTIRANYVCDNGHSEYLKEFTEQLKEKWGELSRSV